MKAILFDMDGTLLDSMGMWHHLEIEFLQDIGVDTDAVDYAELLTLGLDQTLDYVKKNFGISADAREIEGFVEKRMGAFYGNEVQVLPGVVKVLEVLKQKGIPMGVGTATNEDHAHLALHFTGLMKYFDFVYSTSTDGYAKDNPAFFKKAAERFPADLKDIVLFDDAYYAVKTAKEVGYYVVGVKDKGYKQDLDVIREIADEIVLSFEEFDVETWLEDLGF